MKRTYFFALFTLLVSCDNAVRVNDYGISDTIAVADNREVKYSADTNWNCLDVQDDYVCYPKKWKIVNEPEYLFSSILDDEDTHTLFGVLRFDTLKTGKSLIPYLKDGYQTVKNISGLKLLNTEFYQIIYSDESIAFSGNFFTEMDGKYYTGTAMYAEHNGMLYDITLQYPTSDSNKYQSIFEKIIVSLKSNGEHFLGDKKISKLINVDISKL